MDGFERKQCPLWVLLSYYTCFHLSIHSCRPVQHQTFDLQKLVGLVTSDHREAEAASTLLQLRVDEGAFQLGRVSREERLPSCRRLSKKKKTTCFQQTHGEQTVSETHEREESAEGNLFTFGSCRAGR